MPYISSPLVYNDVTWVEAAILTLDKSYHHLSNLLYNVPNHYYYHDTCCNYHITICCIITKDMIISRKGMKNTYCIL